jgi:hypothetical protein
VTATALLVVPCPALCGTLAFEPMDPRTLLAVDVGLKAGMAVYARNGLLTAYRSRNFGSADRLRRGVRAMLSGRSGVSFLVTEGGGPLADIWSKEADRKGIGTLRIHAEDWRKRLLLPREQKSGAKAKESADDLARRIIEWSGAPKPTSLRHDAAEAIAVGLYGVLEIGWLEELPRELRR